MSALRRFRSLLGVGNVPEGAPRKYPASLEMATAPGGVPWRTLAYKHAATVIRLRIRLAEQFDAAKQACDILRVLEVWCSAKPGRGFRVIRTSEGRWQATLIECERRMSEGEDLTDALGQIAQIASSELPVN